MSCILGRLTAMSVGHGTVVEVDDVHTISSAVDVWKHLWVPALGLVTVVSPRVHEGSDSDWGAWLDSRRRSCSGIFRTHSILYVLV